MYRQLLSILLFAMLFASCSDNMTDNDTTYSDSNKITFDFSVNKVFEQETRSGETSFDQKIDHIYLLFYSKDSNGNATGTPVAVTKGNVENTQLSFYLPSELQSGADYKLVAVANAEYYISTGGFETYLKNTSYSELKLYNSECITSSGQGLPMQATDDFSFTTNGSGYNVSKSDSLWFYRLASRLDIFNRADNFVIEGIALCNWRDAVYLDESSTVQGEIQGIIAESNSDTDLEKRFVSVDQVSQRLDGVLYCFPSKVESSSRGDKTTTSLIIKAKYIGSESYSYYRVNLGCNGNRSELKPNTKYILNISKVNGSGSSTPYAAYSSNDESQIVTAVVEDWNIDGAKYVTDSDGHILGVSHDSLEFDCDNTGSQQIKVLCSPDLTLSASFIPSEGTPGDAFSISLSPSSDVTPIHTLTINPAGSNDGATPLSGKCRLSASKAGKEYLQFDISLSQAANDPSSIPDDMEVAIIPYGTEHVKVSQKNKTIEIDGFDPTCFNSFIDIPFTVSVKEGVEYNSVSISTTLSWPLEGGVAKDYPKKYYYCIYSFDTAKPKVYTESDGPIVELKSPSQVQINEEGAIIHLLIGAMAPDDPAIVKTITLSLNTGTETKSIDYKVTVKPHKVIIDDVILYDQEKNQNWLILDRNVQEDKTYDTYSKRDEVTGAKYQAYNYFTSSTDLTIPFKFKNNDRTPLQEKDHGLYAGVVLGYSDRSSCSTLFKNWLEKYTYSNENMSRTSPFYEASNITDWKLPTAEVLDLCRSKMKVSKLRMYLVSDVNAKIGDEEIPICCYWPFGSTGTIMDTTIKTRGYYVGNSSGTPQSIQLIYYSSYTTLASKPVTSSYSGYYSGYMRLVRPLTDVEMENYKNDCLGYGAMCRLQYCHPDTYTSPGWILGSESQP